MIFRLIFSIVLFLSAFAYSHAIEYGAYICTYPETNKDFSRLLIDDGNPIQIGNHPLELSFSLQLRNGNPFGQVLRISADNGSTIDMIFTVASGEKRMPALLIDKKLHTINLDPIPNRWTDTKITVDPTAGNVSLEYGEGSVSVAVPGLSDAKSVKIGFGGEPCDRKAVSDIASVNIRDISIFNNGSLIRQWVLARHNEDICYDVISRHPARLVQGKWLIDTDNTWRKVFSKKFPTFVSSAFDENKNTFYFVTDSKYIYTFNTVTEKTDSIEVVGGTMVANYPNQLIYIKNKDELLSYNLDENLYSTFDFNTRRWSDSPTPSLDHDYWHNSVNYNPADNKLVSFGGYGHYRLNNALLISDIDKHTQEICTIDSVSPRRMMASAIVNDTLYILGGQTSQMGKQEIDLHNTYDLYAIDLSTKVAKKLWEYTPPLGGDDFTFSENMIWDSTLECFYVFSTRYEGQLMRVSLREPKFDNLAKSTDYDMTAQYVYLNLYDSQCIGKFYALAATSDINEVTDVNICELSLPVLPQKEIDATLAKIDPSVQEPDTKSNWLFAVIIIILSATAALALMLRRSKHKDAKPAAIPAHAIDGADSISASASPSTDKNTDTSAPAPAPLIVKEAPRTPGIGRLQLLGGFKVIGCDGNDHTGNFSRTIKHLLILLILHSTHDKKGLSGTKMIQFLWKDKTEESAKNNRNVNISKLRAMLEKVGDVKIVSKDHSYWHMVFGENVQCDYIDAMNLLGNSTSQESVAQLLDLLQHGPLLPGVEYEWIDEFKTQMSDKVIDNLGKLLKRDDISDEMKLSIADTLLQHDYINEQAMETKCSILASKGKIGIAKSIYDNFCREYRHSLDIDYPRSFRDIISRP